MIDYILQKIDLLPSHTRTNFNTKKKHTRNYIRAIELIKNYIKEYKDDDNDNDNLQRLIDAIDNKPI